MRAARDGDRARRNDELAQVERQIRAVIEAIKDGLRTPATKDELLALEVRKETLMTEIGHAPPAAPQLHPKLADLYRERVERLHEELNRPELRAEAAGALRALIDQVRLIPEDGQLEIELCGDLAGILALGAGGRKPVTEGGDGLQVTVVAGARNPRQFTISILV